MKTIAAVSLLLALSAVAVQAQSDAQIKVTNKSAWQLTIKLVGAIYELHTGRVRLLP